MMGCNNLDSHREGWGTAPMCFEGMTLFPNSSWVAPYEVCL
jgi:hypothetical protein